jgi:hypothetical protein
MATVSLSNRVVFSICVGLFLGFVSTFFSGYYVQTLLSYEHALKPTALPTNIPTATSVGYPGESSAPGGIMPGTAFSPGKHYFEDSVFFITKDAPHYTLIATATRGELDTDFRQDSRVSYFDGSTWVRKFVQGNHPGAGIFSNQFITQWSEKIDPSRVLKEQITGAVAIEQTRLGFDSGAVFNEISMRSLPGYSKFMSRGNGSLTINGKKYDAYVLVSAIHSLNIADIQFYSSPIGVTTDWIAFWADDGTFYHVDATSVTKPTPIYASHQIGIREDANGAVLKTFSITTTRDSVRDPSQYRTVLNMPVGDTLQFNRINKHDKYPWLSQYVWFMGQLEGEVRQSNGALSHGFGLVEYITE